MPYKSQAQAAYFNIHRNELESKGVNVDEWNAATKDVGFKLPKHVHPMHDDSARRRVAIGLMKPNPLGK